MKPATRTSRAALPPIGGQGGDGLMFRKKQKETNAASEPATAPRAQPTFASSNAKKRPASGVPSILSNDLELIGSLQAAGEVQLDGNMKGDVRCGSLIAGENATIKGDVMADEVTIRGRLEGNIRARKVSLESTAHVVGDVFHQTLAVQMGAFIDGVVMHTDDPLVAQKIGAQPRQAEPAQTRPTTRAEDLPQSAVPNGNGARPNLFGRPSV